MQKAISVTRYSKSRGFPPREITRLCKEGIIPFLPQGTKNSPRYLIQPDMADEALDKYLWKNARNKDDTAVSEPVSEQKKTLSIKNNDQYLNALNKLLKKEA